MTERRRHPRHPARLGITVRPADRDPRESGTGGVIFHLTEDISRGGLRFTSLRPLAPEDRIRVAVALPDPISTVTFQGTVRWAHRAPDGFSYTMGVELTGEESAQASAWERFVGMQGAAGKT